MRYTYNKLVRDKIPTNIDRQEEKRNKRGGFQDKVYLEYVEEEKIEG